MKVRFVNLFHNTEYTTSVKSKYRNIPSSRILIELQAGGMYGIRKRKEIMDALCGCGQCYCAGHIEEIILERGSK